jgi:hypothetical protein
LELFGEKRGEGKQKKEKEEGVKKVEGEGGGSKK